MNHLLVSVIMPVYNSERYLRESLESILNQTYRNLEVILVDDGCNDGSMKIVDSFKDPRVRVIRNQENLGLAASLNKAIRSSKGYYLARMDADDISYPQRIEKQVEYLDKNPLVHVVGAAMQYIGQSKYICYFPESHEGCRVQLLFNVCFGHPTVVFRRAVFEIDGNWYDESLRQYSEEYDLWCRLVNGYRFHNLDEVLLYYRTYPAKQKSEAELLRRQNSLAIQSTYLSATIGKIALSEMAIHARLSLLDEVKSMVELIECDEWLKRIVILNGERRTFDESQLYKLLALRFYEFCYGNPGLGFAGVTYYYRSEWRKHFRPPLKLRIKQILKVASRKFHW